MLIPPNYTPVQFVIPDDRICSSVYHRWENIYLTNQDTYSYISYVSLARTYNLIYALVRTDKLKILKYLYTVIPTSSAGNIEFYKLNKYNELILKEENNIQEIVVFDGTQFWYKDGYLHRDSDLPALIYSNGRKEWYQNGIKHRDNNLPAIIRTDGSQEWYRNGLRYPRPS